MCVTTHRVRPSKAVRLAPITVLALGLEVLLPWGRHKGWDPLPEWVEGVWEGWEGGVPLQVWGEGGWEGWGGVGLQEEVRREVEGVEGVEGLLLWVVVVRRVYWRI